MYFEVLNSLKIRKCIFRHLNYYVELYDVDFNLISLQTKKLQILKYRTICQQPKLGHSLPRRPIVKKKNGQLIFHPTNFHQILR